MYGLSITPTQKCSIAAAEKTNTTATGKNVTRPHPTTEYCDKGRKRSIVHPPRCCRPQEQAPLPRGTVPHSHSTPCPRMPGTTRPSRRCRFEHCQRLCRGRGVGMGGGYSIHAWPKSYDHRPSYPRDARTEPSGFHGRGTGTTVSVFKT